MIFSVKGTPYKLTVDEVGDEDCSKNWHEVIHIPSGNVTFLDWSPYSTPTADDLELWVELGMPNRSDLGLFYPMGREELDKYKEQKL